MAVCATMFILYVLSQLTKYENKLLHYAGEIREIMQHCSLMEHKKSGVSFPLRVQIMAQISQMYKLFVYEKLH